MYSEDAARVFGAVGIPPIFDDESKNAWAKYVELTVERYKGKIDLFEVWNEPDGTTFWKHGANGTEYGEFVVRTAKAVKKANPDARVVAGAMYRKNFEFLTEAMETGMYKYLDYVSYHQYTHDANHITRILRLYRENPVHNLVVEETVL